jgi:hypothetical protein
MHCLVLPSLIFLARYLLPSFLSLDYRSLPNLCLINKVTGSYKGGECIVFS